MVQFKISSSSSCASGKPSLDCVTVEDTVYCTLCLLYARPDVFYTGVPSDAARDAHRIPDHSHRYLNGLKMECESKEKRKYRLSFV